VEPIRLEVPSCKPQQPCLRKLARISGPDLAFSQAFVGRWLSATRRNLGT
jgi:hypothetical protein